MGNLKERQPRITKNAMLDIWDTITDAEAIRDDPLKRTPIKLRVGFALIRFGIGLLKKII